jgi:hypothetical protein
MSIVLFGIAAFLIGMALGLFFRVFVLIPAVVMAVTAIVAFGLQLGMTFGITVLVTVMAVTALQFGYLAGACIGVFASKSKARKSRADIEAAMRRPSRR